MKNLSIVLLLLPFLMVGCKKDKDSVVKEEEPVFDINNPVGHLIYSKFAGTSPGFYSTNLIFLFDFLPAKRMFGYSAYDARNDSEYNTLNASTVIYRPYPSWGNFTFTIENDKITSIKALDGSVSEYSLIKKPATNQLAGKTFKGKYLKKDGSVLHENFFYTFLADGKTVEVGLLIGAKTRTETYTNVGNIGAQIDKVSGTANDREIMILVDGKLQVNYRDNISKPNQIYHGIFEQVK